MNGETEGEMDKGREKKRQRDGDLPLPSSGGQIKMTVQAEIIQSQLNNQLEKLVLFCGFSELLLRH